MRSRIKLLKKRIKLFHNKVELSISKRYVIELFYRLGDGSKKYFLVAPICVVKQDNKHYLLSLDRFNCAYAFDLARISAMDDYWATFSIAEDFNMEFFKDKILKEGKHVNGYITYERREG